jgi:hypothetical protein
VAVVWSADLERAEGGCGALPNVGTEQFACLVAGAEAEGGDLVVGNLEASDHLRLEDSAVEDEYQRVAPRAVRWDPFDAQEGADRDIEAELLEKLTASGLGTRWLRLKRPTSPSTPPLEGAVNCAGFLG